MIVDDVVSIDTSSGNAFSSTGNLKIDIDSDDNQTDRTFQITSDGSSKTLFQAEEGGDISFYEDTGTTAKFFWDASVESLGIGTSSPSALLHLKATGGSVIQQFETTGGAVARAWKNFVSGSTGAYHIQDATASANRVVIDTSGNVGIGTATPSEVLNVKTSSGNSYVDVERATQAQGEVGLKISGGTSGADWFVYQPASSNDLRFYKTGDKVTIDSSGNLLVGTTSTNPYTSSTETGAVVRGDEGILGASRSGGASLRVNRIGTGGTEDGDIAEFRSNGTTVGSIGTVSTALYIANDDTGLQLYGGGATDQIVPCDGSGVTRNNTIDLGKPTGRFKDLFIGNDIGHLDAAGNARLLYDRSANLLGNAGTNGTFATLSKSSGSFKIDHPLPEKTETHYLVHSFVESPQADNIYRGKVDLVYGLAAVNIDDAAGMTEGTYVLLNTNTQCFTSNESGWTAVKGSVSGNILTITAQDNTCTDTISWMVIGERHDQHMLDTEWTDENGKVIVEPLKES